MFLLYLEVEFYYYYGISSNRKTSVDNQPLMKNMIHIDK